jgi:hypothetical protein
MEDTMTTDRTTRNVDRRFRMRTHAAALVLLTGLAAGCATDGNPTSPGGSSGTPSPSQPGGTALVIPGVYNMEILRTCVNGGSCGTREVPTPIFQISSQGVSQNQMRGHVEFRADGTFHYESVTRTDSPLGKGPEQIAMSEGTYQVKGALVTFDAVLDIFSPGTMTIDSNSGHLLRFYDIPITEPFTPMTINVTETYELIR